VPSEKGSKVTETSERSIGKALKRERQLFEIDQQTTTKLSPAGKAILKNRDERTRCFPRKQETAGVGQSFARIGH
jgi:hypothetical protein